MSFQLAMKKVLILKKQATLLMILLHSHMPKLNTANPEVQAYLLEIARYWIEEYDIDAWRLDVANEVDHAFWKNSGKHVMTQKKILYFREIWHSSQSWLQGDEFHAVMNYAHTDAIMGYFVKQELSWKRCFLK